MTLNIPGRMQSKEGLSIPVISVWSSHPPTQGGGEGKELKRINVISSWCSHGGSVMGTATGRFIEDDEKFSD